MDDIVKIAIIVGIIIIGITGVFVYIKIKRINEEEDSYDEVNIDDKDMVKLDSLDNNSNTWIKDNKIDNDIKDNSIKSIGRVNVVEKDIPEMPISNVKEEVKIPPIVRKEESDNKVNIEPKVRNKIDNKVESKQVSNINVSTSSKPYSNKYSSATLISPVGYYSNELVRNDLMGKRASKVEKPVVSENKVVEEVKPLPNNEIISEEKTTSEVKNNIKEEVVKISPIVKKEASSNRVSFADMKQTYVKKEDKPKNFMEEVSEKLSREIKPQTIELTDYEQKQEDEAIISYQELLANKDKTFNISDDEEDEDFISALKSFRDSL